MNRKKILHFGMPLRVEEVDQAVARNRLKLALRKCAIEKVRAGILAHEINVRFAKWRSRTPKRKKG